MTPETVAPESLALSAPPLARRYPVVLHPQPEGGFVAENPDLPGCLAQGETALETLANLDEARRLWLETAIEHGDPVPEPADDARYSGRLLLRMPRGLHRRLTESAARQGVSLNQHILSLLSEGSVRGDLRRIETKLEMLLGAEPFGRGDRKAG
ncbi:MAG TPA: type II toxin-antitoxin system HicB family antitoxin [Thermoanaerobaculia bacterium]|nr:type II toxin-antitoxin system HicB family antitoxin [Thermoanaerobaculia bacterium]